MNILKTKFDSVFLIEPVFLRDERGFFVESYNKMKFSELGLSYTFLQDNHSYSEHRGTIRGLHYQLPPMAQDKLVRVIKGSILDVVLDLRKNSSTFGQYECFNLSATHGRMLLVPIGFAHGFMTLEDKTEVEYKVTNYYSKELERGIIWNDPQLGISWPEKKSIFLSPKDSILPTLAQTNDFF